MTHHCEPQIRVLDLAEYPLVATVDRQGRPEVSSSSPCPAVQARMLRDLADRVEQSGHACCTAPEPAAAPAPEAYGAEWFAAYADPPTAPVWHGPHQAFDLGVGWLDTVGTVWSWAGAFNRAGIPVMHTGVGQAPQTLDVVDALYGPLSPVSSW